MSTATGRSSRAGSLNVWVSWRIAHLLAVKYATVNTAESETRTVIPRFMFVLGAPTLGDHCAAHSCADAQSRNTGGSSSLWDGNQGLVQVLGKGLVRTILWAIRSTGRW
jgi:hypothetical protein